MHALREVVDFTGVAGVAGQAPGDHRRVSLRNSGDLVAAVVPEDQRWSLRALCAALPTLPPVALAARITAHDDSAAPSRPIIEVDAPTGAVVETVVGFSSGGVPREPASSTARRFVDGEEISGTVFAGAVFTAPGSYEAVVSRVGITGSGVVRLERRLPFRVSAVPSPPAPPPPPGPGPAPGPPPGGSAGPRCDVEIDGSNPGSGATVDVRVFGGGFVPGEALDVLEDDQLATTTLAGPGGAYTVTVGVLRSTVPVSHVFQTVGAGTGSRSNQAGFAV